MKKRILSIFLVVCMCLSLLPVSAMAVEGETGTPHDHTGWTGLTYSSGTTLTGGNYYLNGDMSTVGLTISGDVCLCLNGKTVFSITVSSGATLTLCDCSAEETGQVKNKSQAGAAVSVDGGTLTLESGTIYKAHAQGYGVQVNKGGTFHMTGGTVKTDAPGTGETFTYSAVDVCDDYGTISTFHLSGGTISGGAYGFEKDYNSMVYLSGAPVIEDVDIAEIGLQTGMEPQIFAKDNGVSYTGGVIHLECFGPRHQEVVVGDVDEGSRTKFEFTEMDKGKYGTMLQRHFELEYDAEAGNLWIEGQPVEVHWFAEDGMTELTREGYPTTLTAGTGFGTDPEGLPNSALVPAVSGKAFMDDWYYKEWNYTKDELEADWSDSGAKKYSRTILGPMHFKAMYENARTVTFDANGGQGTMSPQPFIEGEYSKKLTANTFTNGDMIFVGWNTKADGTGTAYKDQAGYFTFNSFTGDITLYAQWMAAHKHAVSVDCETEGEGVVEFTPWTANNDLPTTTGNYVLAQDVTLSDWNFNSSGRQDVVLCLNGHTITTTSSKQAVYFYKAMQHLTLCDCAATPGKLVAGDGATSLFNMNNSTSTTLTILGGVYVFPKGDSNLIYQPWDASKVSLRGGIFSVNPDPTPKGYVAQGKECRVIGASDPGYQAGYAGYYIVADSLPAAAVETPSIDTQPTSQSVSVGGTANLTVGGSVNDGGELSYQWYSNTANSTAGGTAIQGATGASYAAPTNTAGTVYYYCVVTNTKDGQTATVTTDAVAVTVTPAPAEPHTCEGQDHGVTNATPLTSTSGVLDAGCYYLTGDVTLTSTLVIPDGAAVEICLNGHSLTGSNAGIDVPTIQINNGGTLNVYDCSAGENGAITATSIGSAVLVGASNGSSDATFRLYGGTLRTASMTTQKNSALSVQYYGKAYLYGGKVEGEAEDVSIRSGGYEQGLFLCGDTALDSIYVGRSNSIDADGWAGNQSIYLRLDGEAKTPWKTIVRNADSPDKFTVKGYNGTPRALVAEDGDLVLLPVAAYVLTPNGTLVKDGQYLSGEDGSIAYDKNTGILTLNGFQLTAREPSECYEMVTGLWVGKDCEIVMAGESKVITPMIDSGESNGSVGLYVSDCSATAKGSGSLTAEGSFSGIICTDGSLTLESGTLDAKGAMYYGISCAGERTTGNLIVKGGRLTASSPTFAVAVNGELNMEGMICKGSINMSATDTELVDVKFIDEYGMRIPYIGDSFDSEEYTNAAKLVTIYDPTPAPVEPNPPAITTTTLPGGKVGQAYSATLAATGDVPITWSIDGALPAGLTLNPSTGVISGIPTAIGTSTFTVTANNAAGIDSKALAIEVEAPAPNPSFDVSGTVTDGEDPVEGAEVKLMRGNTELGKQTTEADGVFTFSNVAPGAYNIVATKEQKTVTKLVTVTDGDKTEEVLTMPAGNVNSVLDIKDNTPDVVVGGLDSEADEVKTANPGATSITVTMTVEKKEENAADNADAIQAVASGQTLDYLDIQVVKKVDDNDETAIAETATLLQIVIPYDFTNKSDVTVYCHHDGEGAKALSKDSGEEYFTLGDGFITIHAKKFSTYAIGYTTTTPEPGPEPAPGGGGGVTIYPPILETPENGTLAVSPKRPAKGDKVTITVKSEEGYTVDRVTVTDAAGKAVEVTDNGDGTYTFTQPRGKVTISAIFRSTACSGGENCPSRAFSDLDTGAWYHEGTDYVIGHSLMNGYGNGKFGPDDTLSRGMVVTILWRLAGSPATNYLLDYEDVPLDAYYTEAIRWAASVGVAAGYGNGRFGPDDEITREQLATILYRYATYKGMAAVTLEENLAGFSDHEKTSGFAVQALNWAVGQGLIAGIGNNTLDPTGTATRAQAAVILTRYCENILK